MIALTDDDKQRIRQWGRARDGQIVLRYATTGHPMDQPFNAFVEQVAALVPHARLKKDGDATVSLPSLFIGRQVVYQALPLNRELEPFLAVLGNGSAFSDRIAQEVRLQLVRLQAPALVKVYITPQCPYCPATVALILGLAACSDHIRVTIIDGQIFPEAAKKDRVGAVPTVILDDRLRWTGSVDAAELVTLMLDRDPAGLSADALKGMIEEGDAEGVARMMAERQLIFPAFFELLVDPRWSVRLGAMVAFENLAEHDPQLARQVVEPLVAAFADADDTVKGDLLYVLGESGDPVVLPFLQTVASSDAHEEVRNAAGEAIAKLNGQR